MTAIDVGTIVSPGVILDRRTQDELQPPCEMRWHWCIGATVVDSRSCENPADWVVRAHCSGCHADVTGLLCDGCLRDATPSTHDCGGDLVARGEPERLR